MLNLLSQNQSKSQPDNLQEILQLLIKKILNQKLNKLNQKLRDLWNHPEEMKLKSFQKLKLQNWKNKHYLTKKKKKRRPINLVLVYQQKLNLVKQEKQGLQLQEKLRNNLQNQRTPLSKKQLRNQSKFLNLQNRLLTLWFWKVKGNSKKLKKLLRWPHNLKSQNLYKKLLRHKL